ncbi:MAG TPA: response regulator [Myxococcaceae bacterium]|nr:response regulator [Myxococcaceae bacterium]
MTRAPTVLVVDPQAQSRREICEALSRAGIPVRAVADPRQTLAGVRAVQAEMVLVHSEPRGEMASRVLDALGTDAAAASLPVALLCVDTTEARFVGQLRTGIVAFLKKPLRESEHAAALTSLLAELPHRRGVASGRGDAAEFAALVSHLRWTQRSGVLSVDSGTPDEGRILLARGALKSGHHRGLGGPGALESMLRSRPRNWRFGEMGSDAPDALMVLDPIDDQPGDVGDQSENGGQQVGAGEQLDDAEPLLLADEELGPAEPLVQGEADGDELLLESVEEDDAPETPGPPTRPAPARAQAPSAGAVRILLVDDDETLCAMFSTLFRKHGFSVRTASDGYAGYDAALSEPFELVVADLDMPRLDGWGLLRLLREDFRTRELPVAFLSCHEDYRETLRAQQSGAQAYYSKSTRLETLAGQAKVLLEPRFAARASLASSSAAVQLEIAALGPQWVLREIAATGAPGVLEARDAWASYRIGISGGRIVHASAKAGPHEASADRAFNAYLSSRGARGIFRRGAAVGPENLGGPVEEVLSRAAAALNANEQRVREGLLVQAKEIRVNPDLYTLYARIGPRQWLETARLICEERLPPREVLMRVDASPLDVEEAVRDLIRRGVVNLGG